MGVVLAAVLRRRPLVGRFRCVVHGDCLRSVLSQFDIACSMARRCRPAVRSTGGTRSPSLADSRASMYSFRLWRVTTMGR